MLKSLFHSGHALRQRFTANHGYEVLSAEPRGEVPGKLNADDHSKPVPDSIALSTTDASSPRPRPPLMLEHLNRETLAFGMVCPKNEPLRSTSSKRLVDYLDGVGNTIVEQSDDDSFVHATFSEEGRTLGVSAIRDRAGGLAFHVYELPETPQEKKNSVHFLILR